MKIFAGSISSGLLLPLLISLGAKCSSAQTSSPAPSPTPEPVAIKAGRLLDVKTGKIANNVFISIENHRIKSVGNEAPTGVRVIDLSNAFVMPGMVDCHAHVLGNLRDFRPASSLRMSSPMKAIWGARNLASRGSITASLPCAMRARKTWLTVSSRCATRLIKV